MVGALGPGTISIYSTLLRLSTKLEKRTNMLHESNDKTARSVPSHKDNFLKWRRGLVCGRGEYGRGRDDHGNNDDHDHDRRDDQDDAALVKPYGSYSYGVDSGLSFYTF